MNDIYQKDLILQKAKVLAHEIYRVTRNFPKEEKFGLSSQIRRAGVSVPLNIVEGFARSSAKQHLYFSQIAYGSLKEVQFLIVFCNEEKFINQRDYEHLSKLAEEVGKMLYSKIRTMKNKI